MSFCRQQGHCGESLRGIVLGERALWWVWQLLGLFPIRDFEVKHQPSSTSLIDRHENKVCYISVDISPWAEGLVVVTARRIAVG
jgi:hypothetical protein